MMLRAAGAAKRLVYRNLALLLLALSLCEVALGMEFRHIGIQQGLSNRKVYAIASDSSGFMWFATRMGIDRYDGSEFTHYTLESTTPNEVSNYTNTYCITTDNKGVVWALSPNGRLFSYSERYGKFILKAKVNSYEKTTVWDSFLYCDQSDRIWVVTPSTAVVYDDNTASTSVIELSPNLTRFDGIAQIGDKIYIYSSDGMSPLHFDKSKNSYTIAQDDITRLTAGLRIRSVMYDEPNNMLFLGTYTNGLLALDMSKMTFADVEPFTNMKIRNILLSNDNTVMVGVDGAGIYLVDRYSLTVKGHYSNNADDDKSLSGNGVYDIHIDSDKRIWVCSYTGGVDFYDPLAPKMLYISHLRGSTNSLIHDEVNYIAQGPDGDLWFATGNGVSCYSKKSNKWRHFLQRGDGGKGSLVRVCKVASDGTILVGTFSNGMYRINSSTGRVESINAMFEKDAISNFVYDIYCQTDQLIWVATSLNPFSKIDLGTGRVTKYTEIKQVKCIASKNENELYLGSNAGVFVFNKITGKVSKNLLDPAANIKVNHLYPTDNVLWISTDYYGLIKYNTTTGQTTTFNTHNGLPSNYISSVIKDNNGRLWVATERGFAYIVIDNDQVVNYTYSKLLKNFEFNTKAGTRLSDGRLIFGTAAGALIFNPDEISTPKLNSHLLFTDIIVGNRSIFSFEDKNLLKKSLNRTDRIVFRHNQNILTFKFISIDYSPYNQTLYSWKLEGIDSDWSTPSSANHAPYVKIPPGRYRFMVRTVNPNTMETLQQKSLDIAIRRPIWNSIWAWIVYSMALYGVCWLFYRLWRDKTEKRQSDEKVRFFINTAHDLKTPLTLIKAPLIDLADDTTLSERNSKYLNTALSNINKLQNFVNKLLDFERSGNSAIELSLSPILLSDYIHDAVMQFNLNAEHKSLEFTYNIVNDTTIWIDKEVMGSILSNILTNALKYTPEGGRIAVVADSDREQWMVAVTDSGIGIPLSQQGQIFSRYYRADNAANSQITGTGIGLMLVKSLAKQHGGRVSVKSVEGVGSTFTLSFPISLNLSAESASEDTLPLQSGHKSAFNIVNEMKNISQMKIVLAEDNRELREYMQQALEPHYTVFCAENGALAYELVRKYNPDMVITDMMMPIMNGHELCHKIKNDIATSHISVIMLTVLSDRQSIVQGYDYGADDYISKPFDIALLRLHIDNMFRTRRSLSEYLVKMMQLPKNDESLSELDSQFIHKVISVIHENIGEVDFSVNSLSSLMNMSRSGFFNKIKALTGETPVDFVKVIRMKRATELLREGKYNINQISEMVGFPDSKYFSTAFKKFYGKSPSKFYK